MKRFWILLIALTMALTACGGGSGSTTQAENSGEIDPDAKLVVADSRISETLDPHKANNNYDVRYLAPVYDRLIHATADGGIEGGLATEWDFPDELTLELTLREGVKFHDGEAFNAEAVKLNLERAMTLPDAAPVTKAAVKPIQGIEVIDETHVRIKLKQEAYGLIYDLAIQPGFMISPKALNDPSLGMNPVGAGPYKIVSFAPGDRAVYTRFEDYWEDGVAAAKDLEIVYIANADTRLNAVISGEVHQAFVEGRQEAQASGQPDLVVESVPTLSFFNLFINKTLDDMTNDKLRQAVAWAVDREALTKIVPGDPNIQPFPKSYFAYNKEIPEDEYNYDPEKAKELLAEAGYPNGVELSAQVYTRPEDQQMTELLVSQLGKAGITLKLSVVEANTSEPYMNGTVSLFLGRFGGRLDPLQTLRTLAGGGGGLNVGGWTTPEFDAILSEIDATQEGDERTKLIHDAVQELVDEALVIPLFSRTVPYVYTNCLVGFEPFLSGSEEYRGVGLAKDCG